LSALFYFPLVDTAVVASFGQSVTYSRPANAVFSHVAGFALSVAVDASGKYGDPNSKIAASLLVPLAATAIPFGPQKGDLVEVTPGFKGLSAGSYVVQEIQWSDPQQGTALLLIRWTGV
jgi:hypothetical protein